MRLLRKIQAITLALVFFLSLINFHITFKILKMFTFSVAIQSYLVDVALEQVILGNDVLLKCAIPSFEGDFVSVSSWVDSEGQIISVNENYGNFLTKTT
jgi:hypothetical protein